MFPIILTAPYSDDDRHRGAVLYEKYVGLMAHIARENLSDHSLVDDIVSESAIKMLRHIDTLESFDCYQQQQYIVFIVKSVCIDRHRRESKLKTESYEALDFDSNKVADEGIGMLADIISKEGYESIVQTILELPDTLKETAYLFLVHDQNYKEIAELLGITPDNAKMRLSRAKKIIREKLAGDEYGN